MPGKSDKDYEKEIAELKQELEKAKKRIQLNLSKTFSLSVAGSSFSIAGLEEMVLLVDANGLVKYANNSMAKLIGAQDKKELLHTPIKNWHRGILGEGFIIALIESVKSTDQVCVLEQAFPDLPQGLLPIRHKLGSPIILRFIGTPIKDQVQIIAQDVTQNRWLENTFSRYVSPKVIDLLRNIPVQELMKVERRELTILFADLRGFTRVTQEIEPEAVCEMLNTYLSRMVQCVEKYDGTVDKFIGDEIMAVFGAPLHQEDHALRALLCAVAMIESHQAWQRERENVGLKAPAVGIGIVTGEVIVGNIGTEKQMDYTVLGHPVNLAARLCGAAEGLEILTVAETHKSAQKALKQGVDFKNMPHLKFEPKGKLELKNVKAPVEVLKVTVKISG